MTKTVQDKNGKEIQVEDDTPCHAGINGALPVMLDQVLDSDIFTFMEGRDTEAAIEKADYEANHKYKDDRKKLYGTLEQQLENIIEKGLISEKARITAIKNQYPKPQ